MERRRQELLLLCAAAPIVVLIFAMLALTQGQTLGLRTLGVPIGIFVAFILAHLAIRKFAPAADPAILPISFALSGIGICFVTRLAPELATKQVIWLFIGVACMIAILAFVKNIDRVADIKYTLAIIGFVLLLSPLLPFVGQEIYGSRIWLSLFGMSFQPGEIAKIVIVLFLAGYLAKNREELSVFTWRIGPIQLPDLRTVLPLLVMWGISVVIVVFEKDLGSALIFFCVFLIMLYVATGKKVYLAIAGILAAIAAIAVYGLFGHVQVRVQTWLNPFADAQDTGYQLVQAVYSMADGGMIGVGIGNGLATLIPVVESDFIFAAIAEEIGLLGAAAVLLLFVCFAVRGYATAARAKTDVSSLIATGLTSIIVFQAFIIVGGVTRLIPLTGLTLPFISQGGSSLLASFIIVGLLLVCGNNATGVETEMAARYGGTHARSVLGRIALGKRLTGTMIIVAVLFAALVINLTYIMVVHADEYQSMESNNHTLMHEAQTERGTISTSDGVILAKSEEQSDGTFERVYPEGSLAAHVVGYSSLQYGSAGIENACSDALHGSSNFNSWSDVLNSWIGKGTTGNDVVLSINASIQRSAEQALSGYEGACVVLDADTGATLALASAPTYDIADVEDLLNDSSSTALFNRATQALLAPGSTFKIITLAAALENNEASLTDTYESPATMEIGGGIVSNWGKKSYGTITLQRATEVSSNTVYGQLGTQIGAVKLVRMAEKFGFGKEINYELSTVASLMPKPSEMTSWETAWAAAGEPVGEHESPAGPQVTVLQMALVGATVANGGTIINPYLVQAIYHANGEKSYEASISKGDKILSSSTAADIEKALTGVVNNGTGTAAAISGVQVIGKTGTAEHEGKADDSWFVGYVNAGGRTIVIAITMQETGSGLAASRAHNVLSTALSALGLS